MRDTRKSRTTPVLLRQQTALAALGTFALRSEDLQQVLGEAARLCAEGSGAPFCKIAEYRPERGDFIICAGIGWHDGVVGEAVIPAGAATPVGRAFATGKPVIARDLRRPHDFNLPRSYIDHGIVSSANVVIESFGVLEVDDTAPRTFSARDVIFLTGIANICAEMAARLQRQRALQRLATEQGTFLRELQHRVRNHLHILVAQAHALAERTADAAAKRGFDEIIRRIMALATLYDRLLGVRLAQRLDLAGYLLALCDNIRAFEVPEERRVELACAAEPVEVPLDAATAIGIITNELVANALEHAFAGRPGRIALELKRVAPGRALLAVADNGSGMPLRPQGRGLSLVRRLAQQLGGRLELKQDQGTRWELELPLR